MLKFSENYKNKQVFGLISYQLSPWQVDTYDNKVNLQYDNNRNSMHKHYIAIDPS